MEAIRKHKDLRVYQIAFEAAMEIFELPKGYPVEEKYSITDQIRRSSRSICANLAEAWRKRRYQKAFVVRLNDAEAETAETIVWLEFSFQCGFISHEKFASLTDKYEHILAMLTNMSTKPEKWTFD